MKRSGQDFEYFGHAGCDQIAAALSTVTDSDFEHFSVQPENDGQAYVQLWLRSSRCNAIDSQNFLEIDSHEKIQAVP